MLSLMEGHVSVLWEQEMEEQKTVNRAELDTEALKVALSTSPCSLKQTSCIR